jgi:hypothetical protein
VSQSDAVSAMTAPAPNLKTSNLSYLHFLESLFSADIYTFEKVCLVQKRQNFAKTCTITHDFCEKEKAIVF